MPGVGTQTARPEASQPHEAASFDRDCGDPLRLLNGLAHSPPQALGFVGSCLVQLSFPRTEFSFCSVWLKISNKKDADFGIGSQKVESFCVIQLVEKAQMNPTSVCFSLGIAFEEEEEKSMNA